MPILVLAQLAKKNPVWAPNEYARTGIRHDPYQYWHYMLRTSTGRHKTMPILVLTQLAKEKYQYGHQMCMPVLVLDMLRTSTGISEQ